MLLRLSRRCSWRAYPCTIRLPITEFVIYDGAIENGLHYVKDVTMGEDKSLIHVGAGGAVMAALRSAAVSVLHRAGIKRIAATLRAHSQDPTPVLRLLGLLNSSDA